jgi:hypothetical protein
MHNRKLCDIVSLYSHLHYGGISIYRSRNVRFLLFIVCYLWSRIKFHINNFIHPWIHRSPDLLFFRLYRLPREFSCMVRLRKKIEASYLCGIRVVHKHHAWQTVYMYSLPAFICVILSTLPTWLSVSSHPYFRFQYDYGSTKETCENFARPIESNTWSQEESWRETCGHCKMTRVAH